MNHHKVNEPAQDCSPKADSNQTKPTKEKKGCHEYIFTYA
jgi:hypothetical protein